MSSLTELSTLDELSTLIKSFKGCEIAKNATNSVIGQGCFVGPKVFAIGEAPGQEEDMRGIPFCGRSGKLLNKILSGFDLTRDNNLYVTNSVFWRPPNNRKPFPSEIELCRPYIDKMIEISKPKFILLIGATSFESLFNQSCTFKEVRKQILFYKNIPTGVIYHPSYLLRQPNKVHEVESDLREFMKFIESLI